MVSAASFAHPGRGRADNACPERLLWQAVEGPLVEGCLSPPALRCA
jgi:hypothetical protein